MSVVGVAAFFVLFICGAFLIHEPDMFARLWGTFFIAVCGFVLGTLPARLP